MTASLHPLPPSSSSPPLASTQTLPPGAHIFVCFTFSFNQLQNWKQCRLDLCSAKQWISVWHPDDREHFIGCEENPYHSLAGWPVGFYRISTTKQKTRISTKYRPHSTLSTKYRPQNFLKKRILSKLNCPWCNMMCHVLRFICMLSKGCHPVWFVVVCCSFDWDWANL